MHLNMVSSEGFAGSSTSVADIYISYKTSNRTDYLPLANAFSNKIGYSTIHNNVTQTLCFITRKLYYAEISALFVTGFNTNMIFVCIS